MLPHPRSDHAPLLLVFELSRHVSYGVSMTTTDRAAEVKPPLVWRELDGALTTLVFCWE